MYGQTYEDRFFAISTPIELDFFSFSRDLSPLSGGKKVRARFFSRKKRENLAQRGRTLKSQHRLGRPSETRRPGMRLWRLGGYLRFTLGLPWVYLGPRWAYQDFR